MDARQSLGRKVADSRIRPEARARRLKESRAQASPADLRRTVLLWQDRESIGEAKKSEWYLCLARDVLVQGDPLFAYEICLES